MGTDEHVHLIDALRYYFINRSTSDIVKVRSY